MIAPKLLRLIEKLAVSIQGKTVPIVTLGIVDEMIQQFAPRLR